MIDDLRHDADTVVHRMPPGAKLLVLAVAGTLLVMARNPLILSAALTAAVGAAALARLPARQLWRMLKPAAMLVSMIVALHAALDDWQIGAVLGLRLLALVVLAMIFAATTSASATLDALTAGLAPLQRIGLDTGRVALALALALRFIPMLAGVLREVREAQWARGLDRYPLAMILPLLVRALAAADGMAEAIDARSFDPLPRDDA